MIIASHTVTMVFDKKITSIIANKAHDILLHQGAILRKAERQQIRNRKSPSKPGKSPTNQKGILKENIFYAYDSTTDSVVVGPQRLNGSGIPRKLEKGGTVRVSKLLRKHRFGVGMPNNAGGIGPVRISMLADRWTYPFGVGNHDPKMTSMVKGWDQSVEVVWRRLRSVKEAQNAERTYAILQDMRHIHPTSNEKGTIEPRPYAVPAINKSRSAMIAVWRKAILKG